MRVEKETGTENPYPLGLGGRGWQLLVRVPRRAHAGVQHTPLSSEIPHAELSHFYPVSTMQNSLVINIGDATRKIRGNPSRPVRLFRCNEEPLCPIFQKREAALTSPSLCCPKPPRQWLNRSLWGFSAVQQLAFSLHTSRCGCTRIHTHTYTYNYPSQFS